MKALSDLKIVEYANVISGPYCSKLMADLGAEVIKVEDPNIGDKARNMEPFFNDIPNLDRSGLFLYLNTNKLSITLNLKTTIGKKIFKQLLKDADVFIENNRPSTMKDLGLDYETLKEINPGLIMTSITPFGQNGPYKDYNGCDLTGIHIGGVGYITPSRVKQPELEPPLKLGGRQADFITATMAAMATMSALLGRHYHGLGCHLDLSVHEAVASNIARDITLYSYEKLIFGRKTGTYYVYGALPCKDGYVQLHMIEHRHWINLLGVLGNPEWANDELFKTHELRVNNWSLLEPLLMEWSMKYSKDEIYRTLQEKGVACHPVNSAEEICNSRQLAAREFFMDMEHFDTGIFQFPSAPFRFSKTPVRIARPAPTLGEHNEQIYCNRLGYVKEELVKLKEAGVI